MPAGTVTVHQPVTVLSMAWDTLLHRAMHMVKECALSIGDVFHATVVQDTIVSGTTGMAHHHAESTSHLALHAVASGM